jgi:methionyl-tRNA formyltransferase
MRERGVGGKMIKPPISIIVDNPKSWMVKYAVKFAKQLRFGGYTVRFSNYHRQVLDKGIAFYLSCEKKITDDELKRNKHNIVVHPSDLPRGRGWSPLTWQVLEGKNRIPITLFEAVSKMDAGDYYYKDVIELEGHELLAEMKQKQAEATFRLVCRFLADYPNIKPIKQVGKETYYERRTPEDTQLNINKTLISQFNMLRIADNKRYPAFFIVNSHRYVLKIEKVD